MTMIHFIVLFFSVQEMGIYKTTSFCYICMAEIGVRYFIVIKVHISYIFEDKINISDNVKGKVKLRKYMYLYLSGTLMSL